MSCSESRVESTVEFPMPKTELFEKYSDAYDEWFEKNRDLYEAELEAIRQLISPRAEGGFCCNQGREIRLANRYYRGKNLQDEGAHRTLKIVKEPSPGDIFTSRRYKSSARNICIFTRPLTLLFFCRIQIFIRFFKQHFRRGQSFILGGSNSVA